jgi:uncharacterized protein YjiS (DUF1127 family)
MKTYSTQPALGTDSPTNRELSEMDVMRTAERARSEAIGNWLEDAGRWIGRQVKNLFRRGHDRQRILNELNSLDDRTLSDLGITRGDIPFVANGTSRLGNPRNDSGAAAA